MARDKIDRNQYTLKQISTLKLGTLQRNFPMKGVSSRKRGTCSEMILFSPKQQKHPGKQSPQQVTVLANANTNGLNDCKFKLKITPLHFNNSSSETGAKLNGDLVKSPRDTSRSVRKLDCTFEKTTTAYANEIPRDSVQKEAATTGESAHRDVKLQNGEDRDKNSCLGKTTDSKFSQMKKNRDISEQSVKITAVNVGLEEIVLHRQHRAGPRRQLSNPKWIRYINTPDASFTSGKMKDTAKTIDKNSDHNKSTNVLPDCLLKKCAISGHTVNRNKAVLTVTPVVFDPPVSHRTLCPDSRGFSAFSSINSGSGHGSSSGSSMKASENETVYSERSACRNSATGLKLMHLEVFSERKAPARMCTNQTSYSSYLPGYK